MSELALRIARAIAGDEDGELTAEDLDVAADDVTYLAAAERAVSVIVERLKEEARGIGTGKGYGVAADLIEKEFDRA